VALDKPALGNITGVGGALQCGQVLLVRSGGEVVHHAEKIRKKNNMRNYRTKTNCYIE
jgi:hypothetical protein